MLNMTSYLSIAAVVVSASLATLAPPLIPEGQTEAGNASYQEGRRALDRGDWEVAIAAFEEAAGDDALVDAALYWQAYAHQRNGDAARALELVSEIENNFPSSNWLDDARALAAEVRGVSAGSARSDDEEVKLMALNGLMHMEDEEAIPILEELLNGAQSEKLKERALFVLAQMRSDRAYAVLSRVARSSAEPGLQRRAIRYLGIHQSEGSLSLLSELYGSLQSADARREVLQALMIAGEKTRLLEVARTEPDPELRGKAMQLLGTMGASSELWELYERESVEDVKRKLLNAFMVAGASDYLLRVAKNTSESDEIRATAINRLGADGAVEALTDLYRQETSLELKKRILHGLFVAGAEEPIAEVARNASEPLELREAAIHNLGISGDRSRPTLLALYESETSTDLKERVLHSLFIQNADTELIEIARNETDPELRKKAVHWLSLMGSPAAKDFLMELLRQ